MEVTSSTTTTTSSFGQDFSNEGDDEVHSQQQAVSSDVGMVESGVLVTVPVETGRGEESQLGASCVIIPGPLHYGPVVCPDFYSEASVSAYGKDIPDSRAVHGSCGLHNLGNTCFMNSGLQSLMSCSPLVRYFSENFTLDDSTNKTLTGHFYILLCKMWSGQFSVVHPKKFKEFLGLYHSQFEDYRQHDCQEFLAFLLDTLHEQLNETTQPNNLLQLSSSTSAMVCVDTPASPAVSNVCAVPKANVAPFSAASPLTVSCSETELSKHRDNTQHSMGDHPHCHVVDKCSNRKSNSQHCMHAEVGSRLDGALGHDLELAKTGGSKLLLSDVASKLCQYDEGDVQATEEQHQSSVGSDEMSPVSKHGSNDDDSDLITSSGSTCSSNNRGSSLKRFTSRSNLDDVSSSDIGFVVKPSLKRVSADTGVSASGLNFSSEDSNQSSLSVHSTDSEQSSTFKKLKIESSSVDLSSSSASSLLLRSYSNCNSNNNGIVSGLKDFAVTSSSDCKLDNRRSKKGNSVVCVGGSGRGGEVLPRNGKSDESVVSSNLFLQDEGEGSVGSALSPRMDVLVSDFQDEPMEPSPSSADATATRGQLQRLQNLEDFYKKESKTLNTNVLVSDEIDMQEISCDSEKFAKVDNRNRLNSREINLLQEVFDEEESSSKVDKILIAQQFAIKDTNLHTHSNSHLNLTSPLVDNIKQGNKPMPSSHNSVVLNNSYEDEGSTSCLQALSTSSKLQCTSHESNETKMSLTPAALKMANDVAADFSKLDEAEKNIQMQAYSKFNTTPPKSNIRIDLTDNQAVANTENLDEVDNESSDDDEMDKVRPSPPPHTPGTSSSMESECSSVPNCLRTCLPSEVSMANEAWQRYTSTNNSIVVSTFQGQFRSTVVCSECSHVSVTYEPFMYLSLPIPHALEQQMCVTFISYGSPPMRYLLNMMKTDKIAASKKKLKEMIGLSGEVIMAEVLDSHISRILDDNILLKYVNVCNRKIYAFEVVSSSSQIGTGGVFDNGDNAIQHTGLNNEDSRGKSLLRDDLCLVSTSRADELESGLLHPYRTESQMSNQSLDSVHVNTPSSRGTMDLGFSDSEMCDDIASFSSPNHQQQHGFSPSYFRDDCGDVGGSGRPFHMSGLDSEDDVCQSTTSDLRACSGGGGNCGSAWMGKNLTAETLSANAHCLSWQIVQEKDVDDCDETASTVTTVVGSSSSISGDDIVAPCSSSSSLTTKFWVDQPPMHDNHNHLLNRDDSNSVLSRIEKSTIADNDDSDNDGPVEGHGIPSASKRNNGCDSQLGERDALNKDDCTTTSTVKISSITNSVVTSTVTSSAMTITPAGNNGTVNKSQNDFAKKNGMEYVRNIAADEGDGAVELASVCNANVGRDATVVTGTVSDDDNVDDGIATRAGPSSKGDEERPGSYFMQTPCLHAMDSVCHTDSFGAPVEQPMTQEDVETKCLTDNWTTFDLGQHPIVDALPPAPLLSPPHCPAGEKMDDKSVPASSSSLCDEWRSCAICLEDLPVSQLLTHVNCDGVFCQGCLDMSVKHTADISFFCCPICLQPANVCEDFISLPTSETAKLQARLLTMCLAFRHLVVDNTGSSSLQLMGHPNVVEMANVIAGADLYNVVDRLIGEQGPRVPMLTYSVMLTDGQGLNCSRCPYSAHCTGCEITREGEVILRPSDNLTVHSCETLSPDEVSEMQFAYDDPSMASLRSSEPTTIMDCFGAFTQSEILDEHNPWYCPRCERNQCAKKTMTVWRYPDTLIIHLKRFVYQDLSSTKVDTKVVFPHRGMDVRGFLSGPSSPGLTYDLYSVICHFGGASAGHYTSYALHPLTSQWYYYNDETVSLQSPQENEYSSGYVLFYQRTGTSVDFTPPQYLPSMEDIPADVTAMAASTTTTTTTFQQQQASTSYTNAATTSSSSSSSSNNNNMALVLFVPPTSTTSSCSKEEASTKSVMISGNSDNDNDDDNVNTNHNTDRGEYNDEEDDDYDCERRCSPSSEFGSLSVHFGSVFPDDPSVDENSNSNLTNEGSEVVVNYITSTDVTGVTNRGASHSFGGSRAGAGFALDRSPAATAEPDSTYDIFCDEFGF